MLSVRSAPVLRFRFAMFFLNLCLAQGLATAQTRRALLQEDACRPLPDSAKEFIDAKGSIFYPDSARGLLDALLNPEAGAAALDVDGGCDEKTVDYIAKQLRGASKDLGKAYFIMHVVRWADAKATSASKQAPANQNSGDASREGQATVKPEGTGTGDNKTAKAKPQTGGGSADTKAGNTQTVEAQNWYVYNVKYRTQEEFAQNARLLGVNKVWFFYIHLNKPSDVQYQVRYEFENTKKLPQNLADLFALAQLFIPTTAGVKAEDAVIVKQDVWGGREIVLDYSTSNLAITPKVVIPPENKQQNSLQIKDDVLGGAKTFTNEGYHLWDVSAGVPIRKMSELSFSSDNNTVTAKTVDQRNLFGLLDIYFKKVDLASSYPSGWWPHFVGGVAVARQPLHKILLALGYGPAFLQVYAGVLLAKQDDLKTLKTGQSGTSAQVMADLQNKFKPQFAIGVNLPMRGLADKLKKK